MDSANDRELASDPHTPVEDLMRIAADSVELRRYIYANPSASAALREWITGESPEEAQHGEQLLQQAGQMTANSPCVKPASPHLPGNNASSSDSPRQAPSPNAVPHQKKGCGRVVPLLILILLALFSFYQVFSSLMKAQSASGGDSTSHTTASETETTEGSDTTGPTALETEYLLVDTPSKNLSCEIYDDRVGCSIGERYYSEMGQPDCDGAFFSIMVSDGGVEPVCSNQYLGKEGDLVRELHYGETISSPNGVYACSLEETGMTCHNTISGHGFKIARHEQTIF